MVHDDKTVKPPPFALLATEGRGLLDIPALLAAAPFLAAAPRGQPHPVMVLPGLGADDRSTIAIRSFLESLGYQVHGWGRQRARAGRRPFGRGRSNQEAPGGLQLEGQPRRLEPWRHHRTR